MLKCLGHYTTKEWDAPLPAPLLPLMEVVPSTGHDLTQLPPPHPEHTHFTDVTVRQMKTRADWKVSNLKKRLCKNVPIVWPALNKTPIFRNGHCFCYPLPQQSIGVCRPLKKQTLIASIVGQPKIEAPRIRGHLAVLAYVIFPRPHKEPVAESALKLLASCFPVLCSTHLPRVAQNYLSARGTGLLLLLF